MQHKNFMEDLVRQRLAEVLDGHRNTCTCEKCRYDIAALAFDFLPPWYVVTTQGETFTKIRSLEQQFNNDIVTAIRHAVQIVSSQPYHDAK